jgi:hypothetical protein
MRLISTTLLTGVLEPEVRRAELEDHGISEYVRALTTAAVTRPSGPHEMTRRERIHLWVTATLCAAAFVAFCVLTWTSDGAKAFAMGFGAVFTLALLIAMLVWPREYNDHLLNWYTRQGLV